LGLERLREIAALGMPVVAIGGVTSERVAELRAVGAYGVAAIRALWDGVEPAETARRMLEELKE
ncbi:MAG: thiamine phosphate synthase, partial [bacterium]